MWSVCRNLYMPVTRAAARAAHAESEGVEALGLRGSVSHKGDAVWAMRATDAYTGKPRVETAQPQVDHCLEVQLVETALVRAYGASRGRPGSMATAQTCELLRTEFNGVQNLNVTTMPINQAKRGPFTAALNRMREDKLRDVTLEQLARQGKARWLVDNGTWARIERAVVASFDDAEAVLRDAPALAPCVEMVELTLDETHAMLERLGVYSV